MPLFPVSVAFHNSDRYSQRSVPDPDEVLKGNAWLPCFLMCGSFSDIDFDIFLPRYSSFTGSERIAQNSYVYDSTFYSSIYDNIFPVVFQSSGNKKRLPH